MDQFADIFTHVSPNRAVPVGVIGCGYWGPNHLRNLEQLASADLVAVADRRPERLQYVREHYPRAQALADHRALLEGPAEAVVIATPAHTHYDLALEALKAGKHVLVEKPLTTRVDEAMDLVEFAERQGLVLMVGHTFLFNPAVVELRRMVEADEFGKIFHVDSARLNLGLLQSNVDVLWDLAPHDISILLYVLGQEPLAVSARGHACLRPGLAEVGRIDIEFAGGVNAHIHVSWLDPVKVRKTTIVGEKIMAVYDDVSSDEKLRLYDKGAVVGTGSPPDAPLVTYRYGDVRIPHLTWEEPLRLECQEFVSCIRAGTQPRGSGKLGLMVVAVLEAAQRSMQLGGTVELIELDHPTAADQIIDLRTNDLRTALSPR